MRKADKIFHGASKSAVGYGDIRALQHHRIVHPIANGDNPFVALSKAFYGVLLLHY
jgi:hypothetical protein